MKKRVLSMLLAASLVVGMFTSVAFAAEEGAAEETQTVQEDSEPAEDLVVEDAKSVESTEDGLLHAARVEVTASRPVPGDKMQDYYASVQVKVYGDDNKEIEEAVYVDSDEMGCNSMSDLVSAEPLNRDTVIGDTYKYYGFVLKICADKVFFDYSTDYSVNGGKDCVFTDPSGFDQADLGFILFALAPDKNGETQKPLYLDIPYTVNVKKGGNVEPPKKTVVINTESIFDQVINTSYVTVTGNEVQTNGVGSYEGVIRLRIGEGGYQYYEQLHEFLTDLEGSWAAFILGDLGKNWTVDGANAYGVNVKDWLVEYHRPYDAVASDDKITVGAPDYWGGVYTVTCEGFIVDKNNNGESVSRDQSRMTFNLVYTENKTAPKKDEPAKKNTQKKYSSPATGDNSMNFVWIMLMAAAVVCGGSTVVYKKKH